MRNCWALSAGHSLAAIVILGLLGSTLPAAEAGKSALSAADRKLIAWFDTLGFPDLRKSRAFA